ncbi:MAG: hypothetical protein KIS94_13235 [Chitinophagales bacterium]|nr:hypothetical protein [Chitinophagales bacterium]
MKYLLLLACCFCILNAKPADTIIVEDPKDIRYLRYLDSLHAYNVGFAVAKSMADTIKKMYRNASYENYFLHKYRSNADSIPGGFFYVYELDPQVQLGRISEGYMGRNEVKVPWGYMRVLYKRLDSLNVKPCGLLQGAELPDVYIYAKPQEVVVWKIIKRYTVVDPSIKFTTDKDGKTKVSYITKYYYSQEKGGFQKIDSIEKLDPITKKRLPNQ